MPDGMSSPALYDCHPAECPVICASHSENGHSIDPTGLHSVPSDRCVKGGGVSLEVVFVLVFKKKKVVALMSDDAFKLFEKFKCIGGIKNS